MYCKITSYPNDPDLSLYYIDSCLVIVGWSSSFGKPPFFYIKKKPPSGTRYKVLKQDL